MAYIPTVFERAPGLPYQEVSMLKRLRGCDLLKVLTVICDNDASPSRNGLAVVRRVMNEGLNIEDRLPILSTHRIEKADSHERVSHGVYRSTKLELPVEILPQIDLPDYATAETLEDGLTVISFN